MPLALHSPSNGGPRPSPVTVAGALTSLAGAVLSWPGRVIEHRRLMNQMGAMNDRELRDIGLLRQDLSDATAVPFDHDPSALLADRAAARHRFSHR